MKSEISGADVIGRVRPAAIDASISIRRVAFDAPWEWLAAGWRDIWANPGPSLGYGLLLTLVSLAALAGLTLLDMHATILALAGGFMILGPMVAVGLYEISRRREAGTPVEAGSIVEALERPKLQLAYFGLVLAFVFGVWMRLAFMLFAIFFGNAALPTVERFVPELLFTAHGLGLLVVGTLVGGFLALVVFLISAVSVPLLLARDVDVMTAMGVSVDAVVESPKAMLLWAVLIVATMACGIATLFLGLIIAFPLIGHATWHAFRATVVTEPVAKPPGTPV